MMRRNTNLSSKCRRSARYHYLKFLRLEGDPQRLSIGLAFGIFAGMVPVLPFQTILALTLASIFRGSRIAAVLGTWVSNPLTWALLYYSSFKLGAWIFGVPETNKIFASIMSSIHQGEGWMVMVHKMAEAGALMVGTFITGGALLGLMVAAPSYLVILKFFHVVGQWRSEKISSRHGRISL
jgi:uncharacterized protein (DUF2062 family)